MLTRPHELFMY